MLQGTLQAVPIKRNNTKISFIGENTKNNNHKETGNNTKIKLTVNNTGNTNHKEQYIHKA